MKNNYELCTDLARSQTCNMKNNKSKSLLIYIYISELIFKLKIQSFDVTTGPGTISYCISSETDRTPIYNTTTQGRYIYHFRYRQFSNRCSFSNFSSAGCFFFPHFSITESIFSGFP